MKPLSNKVMSDKQLDKWCYKYVPGYKGSVTRSDFGKLYTSMNSGDSCILNLDPEYSRGGTHWVAVRVSSEAPIVYYKDSFGAPPPTDVNIAVSSGEPSRGLIYGNRINQSLDEENCGARSAKFLYHISRAAAKKKEIEYFENIETN